MVLVSAVGDTRSEVVKRAFKVINGEAVPLAKRAFGDDVLLPSRVLVSSQRADIDADGETEAEMGMESGSVVRVGDVRVWWQNDDHGRYTVVHEFGHYHELRTRELRGIAVPDITASLLWSEYFAERGACSVGLSRLQRSPEALEGSERASREAPEREADASRRPGGRTSGKPVEMGLLDSFHYYTMWAFACLDSGHDLPEWMDDDGKAVLELICRTTHDAWGGLPYFWHRFPRWTEDDIQNLSSGLRDLTVKFRPKRARVRRRRRR